MKILGTKTEELRRSEKIRYLLVGFITYITDISISIILISILKVNPIAASICSFLISTSGSYVLTLRYVFIGSTRKKRYTLPLYLFTTAIGIFVTKYALQILTIELGIHYLISKNIAVFFIIAANYFVRKYVIFKQ